MSQIRQIIRKYFNDTHTPKVYKSFIGWLRNDKSANEKDDAFREIWDELNIVPDQSTEQSYIKLQQRIRLGEESSNLKLVIPLYRKILRVASVLIIPIISFAGAYIYVKNNKPESQSVELVEYFVPNGQIRELLLPDSSKVQLNSGSILIYPKTFSGKTRDLYLNGEASFSVTHDEQQPFIVKTADMDIEVLGTVFNVSSYHTNSRTSTTLESGKVHVKMKNGIAESFILEPDDQIILDRSTGETKVKKVDVDNVMSWKKGYIMAESMSIVDISKMLERKYDVSIYINSDKHIEERVTAKFRNNESLTESLSVLQQLIPDMRYKIEGDKVYIY